MASWSCCCPPEFAAVRINHVWRPDVPAFPDHDRILIEDASLVASLFNEALAAQADIDKH